MRAQFRPPRQRLVRGASERQLCAAFSVVHQHATDAVGDAGRLLASIGLDREARDNLVPAAADLGHLHNLRITAQPRSHHHRGGKANLVPAVVDTQLEAAPLGQITAQAVDQRERQVAMGDRRAERALASGALDVDMDPLVVTAQLGELVDHLLGDLPPLAGAYDLILERPEIVDPVRDGIGHARGERHLLSFSRGPVHANRMYARWPSPRRPGSPWSARRTLIWSPAASGCRARARRLHPPSSTGFRAERAPIKPLPPRGSALTRASSGGSGRTRSCCARLSRRESTRAAWCARRERAGWL